MSMRAYWTCSTPCFTTWRERVSSIQTMKSISTLYTGAFCLTSRGTWRVSGRAGTSRTEGQREISPHFNRGHVMSKMHSRTQCRQAFSLSFCNNMLAVFKATLQLYIFISCFFIFSINSEHALLFVTR